VVREIKADVVVQPAAVMPAASDPKEIVRRAKAKAKAAA
jgi:hypothetical protein